MQKLIKTTCKIAAEDIEKERAGHIAEIAQRRYQERFHVRWAFGSGAECRAVYNI